ncbi:MAG: hypothetical protein R3321_07735, partial [Nitrososphaeraceae archaeon]|nr:hypothetical protein [Nitrososphaeraceae archaeon]
DLIVYVSHRVKGRYGNWVRVKKFTGMVINEHQVRFSDPSIRVGLQNMFKTNWTKTQFFEILNKAEKMKKRYDQEDMNEINDITESLIK